MPGIELRAPERTETSSGRVGIAEARADDPAHPLERRRRSRRSSPSGMRPPIFEILVADLGRDREARRHGNAEVRHLGEVRPLSAEKLLHRRVAVRTPLAEEIDSLGVAHGRVPRWSGPPGRRASRRAQLFPGDRDLPQVGDLFDHDGGASDEREARLALGGIGMHDEHVVEEPRERRTQTPRAGRRACSKASVRMRPPTPAPHRPPGRAGPTRSPPPGDRKARLHRTLPSRRRPSAPECCGSDGGSPRAPRTPAARAGAGGRTPSPRGAGRSRRAPALPSRSAGPRSRCRSPAPFSLSQKVKRSTRKSRTSFSVAASLPAVTVSATAAADVRAIRARLRGSGNSATIRIAPRAARRRPKGSLLPVGSPIARASAARVSSRSASARIDPSGVRGRASPAPAGRY